jgi:hypothetical protein
MQNIIYAYTRKQAVEDREQGDVSTSAAEAGIRFPVYLTRTVYDAFVTVAPNVIAQNKAGRLWDIVRLRRLNQSSLWSALLLLRSFKGFCKKPFDLWINNQPRTS